MLKPICVKCELFYKPKKNGVYVIEGMPKTSKTAEHAWVPYKLWCADLWECKGCGDQIIDRSGLHEIAIQHQPDFQKLCDEFKPLLQVNDC